MSPAGREIATKATYIGYLFSSRAVSGGFVLWAGRCQPAALTGVFPGAPGVVRREFPLTLPGAFGFLSGSNLTYSMANTKSAIKAARKAARFTIRNQGVKTRLKTLHKKLDAAIKAGEAAATKAAASEYASAMDKAVKSGVVHKNAASRAKARAAKHSFAK